MFPPLPNLTNFLLLVGASAILALSAGMHSPYAQTLVSLNF
jgi:hypothetical protein